MKESNIKLLILWYNKCKLFYNCHRDSENHYDFWNKVLGFPSIIINLFNSSSLLANNQSISQPFILVLGGLALFSTLLTGAQNYFEFGKLKDQHNKMMVNYSKILFSIEKILLIIQNDSTFDLNENTLNPILNNIESLRETYLHFPEKIWKKNNNQFRIKLENINMNTSDSINIIINSLKSKKDNQGSNNDSLKVSEIITYTNDNVKTNSYNNTMNNINVSESSDTVK
jgi:hypothetical protein